MFTVTNALLMSSATAIVRSGGLFWLKPVVMVLFSSIFLLLREVRLVCIVPTISVYTRWNCLANTAASKSRSNPILTVRCSFQRVFCLGSVGSG